MALGSGYIAALDNMINSFLIEPLGKAVGGLVSSTVEVVSEAASAVPLSFGGGSSSSVAAAPAAPVEKVGRSSLAMNLPEPEHDIGQLSSQSFSVKPIEQQQGVSV